MKKVATRTLASLAAISITTIGRLSVAMADQQIVSHLERLYKRHDRKLVLRASLLGISPSDLREQLRSVSLDTIVKKYGFTNIVAFYVALTGKIKQELRQRGWSEKKLETMINKRLARIQPIGHQMSYA